MVVQDLVGQLHERFEHLGVVVARGEQGTNDLSQMVVGGKQGDPGDGGPGLHGDVPERGGGVDHHAGLLGGLLEGGVPEEVGNQLDRLVPFNGTAGVGEDALFLKGEVAVLIGDHVAPIGNVSGLELDACGGSLQGGAACVADIGVCPENGQDGGVAAGGQTGGAVDHIAHLTLGGQPIHDGDGGVLKGGFVVQGGDGIVSHAVSDDQDVFHGFSFPGWKIYGSWSESGWPMSSFQYVCSWMVPDWASKSSKIKVLESRKPWGVKCHR